MKNTLLSTCLAITFGALTCSLSHAQTETNAKSPEIKETPRPKVPAARGPSLELAIEAAKVAIETCGAAGGQTIGVSVIDSGGVLKVLLAADGTSSRGVQSSTAKAVTALTFKTATRDLTEQIKTDKALGEKITADTTLNARPGGALLKVNGEIIGAIGVGGGSTDHECAIAGIEKIQSRLK